MGPKILLAGDAHLAAALQSALSDQGTEPAVLGSSGLPAALVEIEGRLEAERPQAVVCVGTDDDSLALAITASKLGIPVAACVEGSGAPNERRILATLAAIETGPEPERAAGVIAAWLNQDAGPET